ncbi:uncharacterized protein TNCV_3951951 [Trichonephila clavipes]|nr:uncharacterized protein TNCV_3951951 [Trichonephila clavipes]
MHRISPRYHIPKARPSKLKMQAFLKAKKRWASGQLELGHPSFHDNDPNASGHVSSNYENTAKVNNCTLNSSKLNAATERKMPLLSHTSVGHLANGQYGTGLRSKVKEWRSKGVCIGGKNVGSLKETTIVKLTNFYRKAIKYNCNDVERIKSAIYVILYHCSSTDAKSKHNNCPNGKLSWCFFKRHLANGENPKSHSVIKTKITEEVVAKIPPVYQRLASNEIYCLGVLQVRVKMQMKVCTGLSGVIVQKKVSNKNNWKYLL